MRFGTTKTLGLELLLTAGGILMGIPQTYAEDLLARSWGLNQAPGIEVQKAWAHSKPKCDNSGVVVAVVDTGVDSDHRDLKESLWTNTLELNGKPGVDDDKNGYVDDVKGWDFATNTPSIVDEHGHGTHIAGIISANGSGPLSLKGVCPGVKIMSLRYYNKSANGLVNLQNTIKALQYAVKNGAQIINYSGGGAEFSNEEFEAIREAEKKGILVVAAAGNERNNADKKHYYPAAYPLTNIISVAAIQPNGKLITLSNWGVEKVHVAAPGENILSTLPKNTYGSMSGTSQATAYVSGIAALMMSENRSLKFAKVKELIEKSSVKSPQLKNKTKTGARVNALAAMESLNLKPAKSLKSSKSTRKAASAKKARVVSGKTAPTQETSLWEILREDAY
jgi:thermitase